MTDFSRPAVALSAIFIACMFSMWDIGSKSKRPLSKIGHPNIVRMMVWSVSEYYLDTEFNAEMILSS